MHLTSWFLTIIISSAILLTCTKPQITNDRNLLTGQYPAEMVSEILAPYGEWIIFPTIEDGEEWDKFSDEIRKGFIETGEHYLDYDWPAIPAVAALDFVRSGNRTNYESVSFTRRQALTAMVLAEIFEREGRFTDQIINGIWAICEETYWGVSAHLGAQRQGAGLPDVKEPTVDLFAAETSCQLAWTLYLVGSILDKESPLIRERIEYEINRRVLKPNLLRDDFWWMGADGRTLNNWTPWICSNWLPSILLIEKDPQRRTESVFKVMTILDRFLNQYPADGGCDEGPGYWGEAGAALYDCLETLYSSSDGKIDIWDESLIENMGHYIAKAYINYPYYINFADASAIIHPDPGVVYAYGKRIDNEEMMAFGAWLEQKRWSENKDLSYRFGALGRRQLPRLFNLDEILAAEASEPLMFDFWLPDIQVMGARSFPNSNNSLYLAAKGGHNDESHNHNDVGNFIIYKNGKPAIIDIGVETYTRQTFSEERYTIWTMQSGYHNLPTINGHMQLPGKERAATEVIYNADEKQVSLMMNLIKAYPNEAGLNNLTRSITMERGKQVVIKDSYQFREDGNNIDMNLMTHLLFIENKDGVIVLQNRTIPEDQLIILYDNEIFNIKVERIPVEDRRLSPVWGNEVIRLVFEAEELPEQVEYEIVIS